MNRRVFVIGLILTCLLLSCGVTSNVYDESVPLEKSAVLKIAPYFTIKSYNGIPVQLKVSVTGFGGTGFTIPAGSTTLIYDLDTGMAFTSSKVMGNTMSTETNRIVGKDLTLTFNFEAGKKYWIYLGFSDKEGNYKASNIGETYLALFICQDDDYKNPLHVKVFL